MLLDANKTWPDTFPFRDEFFTRFDDTPDSAFYTEPRYVTHIDDRAIGALTRYYDTTFPSSAEERQQLAVLDICSSWISHYPRGFSAARVAGVHPWRPGERATPVAPMLTVMLVQDWE